jgi:hypothetical protein
MADSSSAGLELERVWDCLYILLFGAYYWGGWYTVFESSGCKHAGVCQLKAGFVAESMMT